MTSCNYLEPKALKELLSYDHQTGVLIWRNRPVRFFRAKNTHDLLRVAAAWNAKHSGCPALTAQNSQGYYHGSILGKTYFAHRVAWAIFHGEWPACEVDHINGNRLDNRMSNLREATRKENMMNRGADRGGSSRFCGVHWNKKERKWQSRIGHGGNHYHIGYFSSEDAAARAYDKAANEKHGEFARLNFPKKDHSQ